MKRRAPLLFRCDICGEWKALRWLKRHVVGRPPEKCPRETVYFCADDPDACESRAGLRG